MLFGMTVFVSADDLADLKTKYETAVKKAVEPLNKVYEGELQKLLEKYSKSGDLIKVEKVSEEYKKVAKTDTNNDDKKYISEKRKLCAGVWSWKTITGKSTIQFLDDNTCVHSTFNGTYFFEDEKTIKIENANNDNLVLVFDFPKGIFNGVEHNKKQQITGEKYK